MAKLLVDAVLDKKGSDILLLDVRDQAIFADFFLLASGGSDRQLKALYDGVLEDAKQKANILATGSEGNPDSGWILVDFGDLIVHLFSPEKRRYYALEELWDEAHTVMRMD